MENMKFSCFFLLGFFWCSLNYAQPVQNLEALSWKTSYMHNASDKVSAEMISDFINQKKVDWHPITASQIGEYRWIDIDGDKTSELFVTVALSRRFFNTLFIFKSSGESKSLLQRESVWMLENLDLAVKDLDKDGFNELILPKALTSYRGMDSPLPIWKSIYKWSNGKFVTADSEYLGFYKDLLPSIEHKISEADKRWSTADPNLDETTLRQNKWNYERLRASQAIIRDKILRLIGTDPLAGYKEALLWAQHPDRDMKKNAIAVFKDIFDQNSRKQLEILSKDSDQLVANQARFAIHNNGKLSPKGSQD
jgi:hypothetical protein